MENKGSNEFNEYCKNVFESGPFSGYKAELHVIHGKQKEVVVADASKKTLINFCSTITRALPPMTESSLLPTGLWIPTVTDFPLLHSCVGSRTSTRTWRRSYLSSTELRTRFCIHLVTTQMWDSSLPASVQKTPSSQMSSTTAPSLMESS